MILDTLTYSIAVVVVILSLTVFNLARTKHRTNDKSSHRDPAIKIQK